MRLILLIKIFKIITSRLRTILKKCTKQLWIYKQQQQDQQDARDFAYKNSISSAAYQIGNRVYDTATGQELDPSSVDSSQIQVIDPNSEASKDYVKSLSEKYGDTVFPTMTPEQAQEAMKYSKIYREQVRPPEYITNPKNSTDFKFDSSGSSRLLAAGLTNTEVQAIQTNVNNGVDINTILNSSSLSDEEKKAVKDVMGGVSPTQATKDTPTYNTDFSAWLWQNYTRDELTKAAKNKGFGKDPDAYIASIVKRAGQYRQTGTSDQDIMNSLIESVPSDIGGK
jgi:hypothetical protein